MYGELDMWAKRQELQRELARLDLLTEAKRITSEKRSKPRRVARRVRSLASSRLSPLRLLGRTA